MPPASPNQPTCLFLTLVLALLQQPGHLIRGALVLMWSSKGAMLQCPAGVLTPAVQEGESFTFTMCNPPFFESMEEAGQNPSTAFSGTATEMVCPGGELAFATRMLTDSLQLKARSDTSLCSSVWHCCERVAL